MFKLISRRMTGIIRRITGISTPLGGISWEPPGDERDVIRNFITFLEDRRVLYNHYELEIPHWCTQSVVDIRREITRVQQNLAENSDAQFPLRNLQLACRKFLDQTDDRLNPNHPFTFRFTLPEAEFFTAIGGLRGVFGVHLLELISKYNIKIEGDLASILPYNETNHPNHNRGS